MTCGVCGGTGGFVFDCDRCQGEGKVERRMPVPLRIPPGVREGTVFQVVTDERTAPCVLLTVHIRHR
jgi:DnaJ-class molecular chaperone